MWSFMSLRLTLFGFLLCAAAAPADAQAQAGAGQGSYLGRPIYSEPATGLQLPPGCLLEPSWRSRLGATDFEVWVASCGNVARTWMLRRSLIEMVGANQARLRYVVIDERVWPDDVAGDTLSVQCLGRGRQDGGYVVAGAKWRAQGKTGEVALQAAGTVLRADPASQKFVPAGLAEVECARYPEREAMMRRLQQAPR